MEGKDNSKRIVGKYNRKKKEKSLKKWKEKRQKKKG